jgi:hypothetical protein
MDKWRAVLGVNDEEVDFDFAHMKYREKTLTLRMPVTLDDLRTLNRALDEAEKECGGCRHGRYQKRA